MNSLVSKITPLTKAIIWLVAAPIDQSTKNYKAIDYLLNGLLTSSINASGKLSSRLLLVDHFSDKLHVFISHTVNSNEVSHFVRLIEPKLTSENNILLIDETAKFDEINKFITPSLRNNIVKFQ